MMGAALRAAWHQVWQPTPASTPASSVPIGKRNEQKCREILERLVAPHAVHKVRPDWLRNPKTGRCMELDMYIPDLQLAVEYNGSQHYVHTELHRDEHALYRQRQRDRDKRRLCAQRGVTLIEVPFTARFRMEEFLRAELGKAGIRCRGSAPCNPRQ